jgi:hypothetical protein
VTALPARFWASVDKDSGDCWVWTGGFQSAGYGRFCLNGRDRLVHRFAYEALVAPIPAGLVIDHLCRNRACVNPAHLEPVTNRVNLLRGIGAPALNAAKTHCDHGHEFSPENTYREPKRPGYRFCRRCRRDTLRRFRARRAARELVAA